jgi:hypothetical protein
MVERLSDFGFQRFGRMEDHGSNCQLTDGLIWRDRVGSNGTDREGVWDKGNHRHRPKVAFPPKPKSKLCDSPNFPALHSGSFSLVPVRSARSNHIMSGDNPAREIAYRSPGVP